MELQSINYDPFNDITSIFLNKEALDDIDSLLFRTKSFKDHLEYQINNEQDKENTIKKSSSPNFRQEQLKKISDNFQETERIASTTQSTITSLTEGLSHLDNAKKNLTTSLNLFQNLKILVDSYFECKKLLQTNSYLEMVSPFKIMCSLSDDTFIKYKSVDDINKLLSSISRLKSETGKKIKITYTNLINDKINLQDKSIEKQLREGACELLDSESKFKNEITDYILDKLLYEIKEIFQIDDEAGALENLSRRYIFFKKVLNNFNSKFSTFFPVAWDVPLQLTKTFYKFTGNDLQILLRKELKEKTPSIDLFMKSLQTTLDFEKYIDVRFSNKCKEIKLSNYFEPYLSLWVSHQDKTMESKMLSYMSEPKIPASSSESLVVPSIADLFRKYRSILSETLELVGDTKNESILILLSKFFSKWLLEYLKKILAPLQITDNIQTQDKSDVVKYTVLLVNTCDYCSTTIDQLEERLSIFSSGSRKVSDPFTRAKDAYDELLANSNNLLLKKIIPIDLSFSIKEFDNTDWAHILVEDYSRYMVTLKKTFTFSVLNSTSTVKEDTKIKKSALEDILLLLNRDVYKWNFFDNFIDILTSSYVECIVRLLQPLPPFISTNNQRRIGVKQVINIGEQLLLDIDLLKTLLYSMSENIAGNDSLSNPSFKRIRKHIDANLDELLGFLKILVAPMESAEDYFEIYSRLSNNNCNSLVWAFTFVLKGTNWDLQIWKKYWDAYNSKITDNERAKSDKEYFIFKWDNKHFSRFGSNMRRIQDVRWVPFLKDELKLNMNINKSGR